MKVSEYRDLISELSDVLASCRSAANEAERFQEARRLTHCAKMLNRADCPRAADADRSRAARVIQNCSDYLFETGLDAMVERQEQADANLTRMAFAGEYR